MKINIKYFSIALTVVLSTPIIILFIWCAANGFGIDVVRIFESLHPNAGFSIVETGSFVGVAINSAYAIIDSFIFSFAFASLYNFLVSKGEKKVTPKK